MMADATESKKKVEVIARKSYKEQRARAEKAAVAAAAAAAIEEAAAAKRKASGMGGVNFVALGDAMHHPALPRFGLYCSGFGVTVVGFGVCDLEFGV